MCFVCVYGDGGGGVSSFQAKHWDATMNFVCVWGAGVKFGY